MSKRATGLLAALLIGLIPVVASAQLAEYNQDFESLVQSDSGALGADGWLVFGNVFAPGGEPFLYGYGPFPAPNSGVQFCAISTGEGGPGQGGQQLAVFSDYNNADHANGFLIESNTFQEQTIGAGDVGMTWHFTFQAKVADLDGSTIAGAFIKTLDPNNGYALTNFIGVELTRAPTTWGDYILSISIDPALSGQILQFGFLNMCTEYEPSTVIYDNLSFQPDGAVPATQSSMGQLKSQFD